MHNDFFFFFKNEIGISFQKMWLLSKLFEDIGGNLYKV
jgi:hypothetical protein